jgi:hypothetical protein
LWSVQTEDIGTVMALRMLILYQLDSVA